MDAFKVLHTFGHSVQTADVVPGALENVPAVHDTGALSPRSGHLHTPDASALHRLSTSSSVTLCLAGKSGMLQSRQPQRSNCQPGTCQSKVR